MNGSGSIQSLPSDCFLSDAFVVFSQKVGKGHFRCSKQLHRSSEFLERGSNRHAVTRQRAANHSKGQQSQSSRRRPDAAGGKAFRRFLAHFCCCLFFPLGFKFCCIVLRVANARDLIIDLQRLCYLQLKLRYPIQYLQFPVHFRHSFESHRLALNSYCSLAIRDIL